MGNASEEGLMPTAPKTHRPPGMPAPGEAATLYAQTRRRSGQKYKRTPKGQEANRFYASRRWRKVRKMKLARDPICQGCQERAAEHAHHIRPRLGHPTLAYDLDNLMSLCPECHGRVRADDG